MRGVERGAGGPQRLQGPRWQAEGRGSRSQFFAAPIYLFFPPKLGCLEELAHHCLPLGRTRGSGLTKGTGPKGGRVLAIRPASGGENSQYLGFGVSRLRHRGALVGPGGSQECKRRAYLAYFGGGGRVVVGGQNDLTLGVKIKSHLSCCLTLGSCHLPAGTRWEWTVSLLVSSQEG